MSTTTFVFMEKQEKYYVLFLLSGDMLYVQFDPSLHCLLRPVQIFKVCVIIITMTYKP